MKLRLSADDTRILITGKNINESASNLRTINSIISWFDNNRLIINKDRSLTLDFHHTLNKNIVFPDIILKDGQITYVPKTKFLGLWLNHKLSWNLHVENLMKKLHKLRLAIKTLRTSVNKNVLKTTYSAYFHSTLKYGILFWENLKNLTKIFKLRKKLIRLIASVSSTTSCKPYFKELKIMTLPSIKFMKFWYI